MATTSIVPQTAAAVVHFGFTAAAAVNFLKVDKKDLFAAQGAENAAFASRKSNPSVP